MKKNQNKDLVRLLNFLTGETLLEYPGELNLNGNIWKIEIVKDLEGANGRTSKNNQVVWLKENIKRPDRTFFHEIGRVFCHENGIESTTEHAVNYGRFMRQLYQQIFTDPLTKTFKSVEIDISKQVNEKDKYILKLEKQVKYWKNKYNKLNKGE